MRREVVRTDEVDGIGDRDGTDSGGTNAVDATAEEARLSGIEAVGIVDPATSREKQRKGERERELGMMAWRARRGEDTAEDCAVSHPQSHPSFAL